MKVQISVSEGVATFSIPDHGDTPSRAERLTEWQSGKALREAIMSWAKEYGVNEAEGF